MTSLCFLLLLVLHVRGIPVESSSEIVIMDVDPGIDDAMAILTVLGDPSVTVEAITCVRGNTDVETVVVNVYKTLAVAGRLEIPVYRGENYGLLHTTPSDNFFGKDGFGDLGDELEYDPQWATLVEEEHAAAFLARIVSEKPGQITILALGPLTNIALALELNPNFLKQALNVICLGGSINAIGNVAPGVEFNFFQDPDAAYVVMDRAESTKANVTLVPMETIVNCDLGKEFRWEKLSKIGNNVTKFLDKLDLKHIQMYPYLADRFMPYDTYAAVTLLNPKSVILSKRYYGSVETCGTETRGVILLDYGSLLNKYPNLKVILAMSRSQVQKTILSNLKNY